MCVPKVFCVNKACIIKTRPISKELSRLCRILKRAFVEKICMNDTVGTREKDHVCLISILRRSCWPVCHAKHSPLNMYLDLLLSRKGGRRIYKQQIQFGQQNTVVVILYGIS